MQWFFEVLSMQSDQGSLRRAWHGQPSSAVARWWVIVLAVAWLDVGASAVARAQGWATVSDDTPEYPRGALSVERRTPSDPHGLAYQLAADDTTPPAPTPEGESALDRALRELQPSEPSQNASQESPLDRAVRELNAPESAPAAGAASSSSLLSAPHAASGGGAEVKLVDIALDGLFAAGTSTEPDIPLQDLEGGGHDPRKRGFTVRGVEFSMQGAVDPYFDGEMHIVTFLDPIEGATETELEEAFMTTRSLPHGYQIKAGQFLTEFGRINPTHPHAWAWLDQPIIATRVFGPDGMRGPGVRVSWLVPSDHFQQVYATVQNANGETMPSFLANAEYFEERPIGGRPFVYHPVASLEDLTYTLRHEDSWTTCCEEVTWLFGQSMSFGSNCTGNNGNTQIYGLDLTRKWKPAKNDRGWPFTIWMSEFIVRRYGANAYFGPNPADPLSDLTLPAKTLTDYGFYTQYLYGFRPKWAAGLRYEYVWGSGASLNDEYERISHNEDPFRDNRHRAAPLLAWYPTEFSRFTLQYNFDYAEHLPHKTASSLWLGAEFMLGAHPAHKF